MHSGRLDDWQPNLLRLLLGKGQLISERNFDVFKSLKQINQNFQRVQRIFALVSKMSKIKKAKGTLFLEYA